MVARATALREQLYEEADAAEERGGYSPELHRAFPEAGFSSAPATFRSDRSSTNPRDVTLRRDRRASDCRRAGAITEPVNR